MPAIQQAHRGQVNTQKQRKKEAREKIESFRENPGSINSVAQLREIVLELVELLNNEVNA